MTAVQHAIDRLPSSGSRITQAAAYRAAEALDFLLAEYARLEAADAP